LKNKTLTSFPNNLTLVKVIKKEEAEKIAAEKPITPSDIYKMCSKHNKPCDLACIDCKIIICSDCGLFGDHKAHDIRRIEQINQDNIKKAALIEETIKKTSQGEENNKILIANTIDNKKKDFEEFVEGKFSEFIAELTKKKEEMLAEANVAFERISKHYLETKLPSNEAFEEKINQWKNDIQEKYNTWKTLLNGKPDEICYDIVRYPIDKHATEVNEWLESIQNNYESSLKEKLNQIEVVFDENFLIGIENICELQTDTNIVIKKSKSSLDGKADLSYYPVAPSTRIEMMTEESKNEEIERSTSVVHRSPNDDAIALLKQSGINIEIVDEEKIFVKGSRQQHHKINDAAATQLFKGLTRLKKCSALSIDLSGCGYQITSQGLTVIAAALPKLVDLKYLEINMRGCGVGDTGSTALSVSIPKLIALKKLKLIFNDCKKISDKALYEFGESISKTSLTDLELGFAGCIKITDKGLNWLSSSLGKISKTPGLNKLTLNFQSCDKITDSGMSKLVTLFQDLPWVETLDLNFDHCNKLTNSSITVMCNAMEKSMNASSMIKFFNIKNLNLAFGSCDKLDNRALTMIAEQISKLNQLEVLGLDFSYCENITDSGLSEFSKTVIRLKSTLKNIKLNFQGCERITETGVIDISLFISNLTNLSGLKLVLSDCKKLGDDVIGVLSIKLCSLPSLKHLHLSFSRCGEIGDDSLSGLAHSLKNLWTIEDLSLHFAYCSDIGNNGIQALCESLGSLNSTLSQLKLNFGHCDKVGDAAIIKLSERLSQFSYLKLLELHFVACNQITGEGINALSTAINKLSSIENLQLYFHGCPQIDESAKSNLQRAGSRAPQHYVFI